MSRIGHGNALPFWGGSTSIGSLPRCGMDFRVFKIKIGLKKKDCPSPLLFHPRAD
jgi:hypothetical protein